ncbi:MAG: DEAD/DEAH box helicase [Acidobacteriaceae bacterium]|nr:DEAD/DEAH box helicase [Acidobacteriaceae bacterium]
MLFEEQISERRLRAAKAIARILARPDGDLYGDYSIKSTSGKTYRVALRGANLFENFCSCPDFAVNTLGTCKHIEALLTRLRKKYRSSLDRKQYERTRASLSLHYGDELQVRLRLPAAPSKALLRIAEAYCDSEGVLRPRHFKHVEQILDELRRVDDKAVVYSDVLEFLNRENENREGLTTERKLLARLQRGRNPLDGLLKVPLYPYQAHGAIFAACRGRVILADDMGLGKTIQTIAAAELLRRKRAIQRVLVVAPASVKYQWKSEIEKFSDLSAQVIDGLLPVRRKLYAAPAFFNLSSYEVVLKDIEYMHAMQPDLIVLDEAQRIRNWTTATARTIKQLKSRYVIVLTGTPLENKLEELFSIVEFVDGRRLGPAFRFLKEHRMEDEKGKLLGYRGLDRIHQQLEPILLRRTRQQVLPELPARTDQIFRVPMTKQQEEPYLEQRDILAQLLRKWERQGWLSEIDLRRVTCCIQNMRMLCNSTFLFDKETHYSPKLKEFREIIQELVTAEDRKVVVFSEYERMTYLAGEELKKLGIDFVSLHGRVPSRQRGGLVERFRDDATCKVFLSTDAGGVGLNLQTASAVLNFEPPWNPARLEQRIGRVHRLGQGRPVQVIHFLTEDSIEEHVWETLRLKKSLFSGVFDSTASEIDFAALNRKSVLQEVKEIFSEQPSRPKPDGQAMPQPPEPAAAVTEGGGPTVSSQAHVADVQRAAAGLVAAGVRFLESITSMAVQSSSQSSAPELFRAIMGSFAATDQATSERIGRAAATLLAMLSKPSGQV